jgi:ribosomal protein L39E
MGKADKKVIKIKKGWDSTMMKRYQQLAGVLNGSLDKQKPAATSKASPLKKKLTRFHKNNRSAPLLQPIKEASRVQEEGGYKEANSLDSSE